MTVGRPQFLARNPRWTNDLTESDVFGLDVMRCSPEREFYTNTNRCLCQRMTQKHIHLMIERYAMGRPCIRALLVALVCVLTAVSTSWGRSRAQFSTRRGHPNERHLRTASVSPLRVVIIRNPVSGTPMFGISIASILGSQITASKQSPAHIKQEKPRD